MKREDFLNKYIEDLSFDELTWLSKNSFIDPHTYNGRMMQLDGDYIRSTHLKELKIIKEIEDLYFNDFLKNKHYLVGMEIYEKFFKLYNQLKYKFQIYVDQEKCFNEIVNLYKIISDIQKTAVKDFYSHIGIYLKQAPEKYQKKLIKPIVDIDNIWRLRPNFVVRDLKEWKSYIENPNNSAHRAKQLISYAMVLCEYKKYEESKEILEEILFYFDHEDDRVNGFQKRYAFIYYNLLINFLLKDYNSFKKVYDKYYNIYKDGADKEEITLLFKLSNINYMLYYFNKKTKKEIIKENVDIYRKYFKYSNLKIKKSIILNNFQMRSYRHEHIGEVLCNLKGFHDFIYHENQFYFH